MIDDDASNISSSIILSCMTTVSLSNRWVDGWMGGFEVTFEAPFTALRDGCTGYGLPRRVKHIIFIAITIVVVGGGGGGVNVVCIIVVDGIVFDDGIGALQGYSLALQEPLEIPVSSTQ